MESIAGITAAIAAIDKLIKTSVFQQTIKSAKLNVDSVLRQFSNYYASSLNTYGYVKTLVNQDQRHFLRNLYVEQVFVDAQRKDADEYEIIEKLRAGEKLEIKGHGGSGKTFFVKKLFLDICENPMGKFPIFLELRNLNDVRYGVETSIKKMLGIENSQLFLKLARQGKFIFILDGFDEIKSAKRGAITKQISQLAFRYPQSSILVSSRHSEEQIGWDSFLVYNVKDFNRKQTLELFEKIDYPKELKEAFVSKIDNAFFEKHQTFLSSPLMALMMLITFGTTDQIPTKFSEYYDLSFRAMFYRHDSMKQYTRERSVGFAEFQKFFSYFCLISYSNSSTSFSESEFERSISKTKSLAQIDVSVDLLKRELTESACMLYKDGTKYVFIHRSYQEYFCALGVVNYIFDPQKKRDVYERLSSRITDNVIPLAYQLNSQDVEANYIVPMADIFQTKLSSISKQSFFEYHFSRDLLNTKEMKHAGVGMMTYLIDMKFYFFIEFVSSIAGISSDIFSFDSSLRLSKSSVSELFAVLNQSFPKHKFLNSKGVISPDGGRLSVKLKGNGELVLISDSMQSELRRNLEIRKILKADQLTRKSEIGELISAVRQEIKEVRKRVSTKANFMEELF